jgi:DnaJ-class molecular chaperone
MNKMSTTLNAYEVLGIREDACQEVVEAAIKALLKKWHPDLNQHSEASEMTRAVLWAKEKISDSTAREQYNKQLQLARQPQVYFFNSQPVMSTGSSPFENLFRRY